MSWFPADRLAARLPAARDVVFVSVLFLLALSVVMVFSASAFHWSVAGDPYAFLRRQLQWVAIAVLVGLLVHDIDTDLYRRHYPLILGAALLLLALVWVPPLGRKVNQSWRWIRLGPGLGFQPSELAKIAVVLFIAGFLSGDPERKRRFVRGYVPLVTALGAAVGLVLCEPDLGTSIFLLVLAGSLLVLAGVRWRYLLGSALAAIPLLGYFVHQRWDTVATRLQGMLEPEKLYQVAHSLRALGTGGSFGVGLGASTEKLLYLPEAHTDFILAVIGEELGFAGTAAVVLCYVLFVSAGGVIASRARDQFGFLLAAGITLSLGLQAAINISVVTASAPTKGMALPLVTFGGSGLCVTLAEVGILMAIARESSYERVERDGAGPRVAAPART